jgi:hypothetical protein
VDCDKEQKGAKGQTGHVFILVNNGVIGIGCEIIAPVAHAMAARIIFGDTSICIYRADVSADC